MNINLVALQSALSETRGRELEESKVSFLDSLHGDFSFSFGEETDDRLSFYFIQSGGSEAPYKKIYQSHKGKYYLLTHGDSNSLASALEILSFLQLEGKEGYIIYGSPEEVSEQIEEILSIEKARYFLSHSTLGIIGKPSDWLISSSTDFALVKQKLGVSFIEIDMKELVAEIDKESFPEDKVPVELLRKAKENETVKKALFIYGALKRLCQKYSLTGFSIRCFDLLGLYKNTACLALSLLNSEGIVAGCEGDETSLLTMMIFKSLSLESFQCNPSVVDVKQRKIVLAHCTLPWRMATEHKLMSHFESGLGIGIRGKMKQEKVTILKLSPKLDQYHLFSGEIIENLERANLCRTQIIFKANEDFSFWLQHPFGNHLLLAYGDVSSVLVNLLKTFGIYRF